MGRKPKLDGHLSKPRIRTGKGKIGSGSMEQNPVACTITCPFCSSPLYSVRSFKQHFSKNPLCSNFQNIISLLLVTKNGEMASEILDFSLDLVYSCPFGCSDSVSLVHILSDDASGCQRKKNHKDLGLELAEVATICSLIEKIVACLGGCVNRLEFLSTAGLTVNNGKNLLNPENGKISWCKWRLSLNVPRYEDEVLETFFTQFNDFVTRVMSQENQFTMSFPQYSSNSGNSCFTPSSESPMQIDEANSSTPKASPESPMLSPSENNNISAFKCPWSDCNASFTTIMGFKYHTNNTVHVLPFCCEFPPQLIAEPPADSTTCIPLSPLAICIDNVPHRFDKDSLEQFYTVNFAMKKTESSDSPGASSSVAPSKKRFKLRTSIGGSPSTPKSPHSAKKKTTPTSLTQSALGRRPSFLGDPIKSWPINLSLSTETLSNGCPENQVAVSGLKKNERSGLIGVSYDLKSASKAGCIGALDFVEGQGESFVVLAAHPLEGGIQFPCIGQEAGVGVESPVRIQILRFPKRDASSSPVIFQIPANPSLPMLWVRRISFLDLGPWREQEINSGNLSYFGAFATLSNLGVGISFFSSINREEGDFSCKYQELQILSLSPFLSSDETITDMKTVSNVKTCQNYLIISSSLGKLLLFKCNIRHQEHHLITGEASSLFTVELQVERSILSNCGLINHIAVQQLVPDPSTTDEDSVKYHSESNNPFLNIFASSLDGKIIQWKPFQFPFHPEIVFTQFALTNDFSLTEPIKYLDGDEELLLLDTMSLHGVILSDSFGYSRLCLSHEDQQQSEWDKTYPRIRQVQLPGIPKNTLTKFNAAGHDLVLSGNNDTSVCISHLDYSAKRRRKSSTNDDSAAKRKPFELFYFFLQSGGDDGKNAAAVIMAQVQKPFSATQREQKKLMELVPRCAVRLSNENQFLIAFDNGILLQITYEQV